MDEVAIKRIMQAYGYDNANLLKIEKGYRNASHLVELTGGRQLNLILYKSEPGIARTVKNANQVSDFLAAQGLPARHTADPRILQLQTGRRHKLAALYNYLPGNTIPWEAYTMKHIKLLGKTMSDMHAALQDSDTRDLPDVAEIYLQIFVRMQRYFADPGVVAALAQKLNLASPDLDNYIALLKTCKHLPNQQALHMDFVRSNVLFDDSAGELTMSGILDFEKTACGHCVFDIARTLAFLLVDCKYKPPHKVRKYFLQSGYQKRGAADFRNLTIQTKSGKIDVLDSLINLFLLHDFYKFLRHNPYESLSSNDHFIRTVDLLFSRKLLAES